MSINEKAINALEFDKIRTILASHCPTAGARARAFSLEPLLHVEQIAREQKKTTKCLYLFKTTLTVFNIPYL